MPPQSFALKSAPPTAIVTTAAAGGALASVSELEGGTLESYVKSKLLGGFAAQRICGTDRRKCAIAQVVLQEGTGKAIINCRDATVDTSLSVTGAYSLKAILRPGGCMSPEYALEGDVFSFGVLLLEIVSGRRNIATNSFSTGLINLLGHAEVSRCIHVALICVQEAAADRPTTSDILAMLSNENASLPTPKEPAFFTRRNIAEENSNTGWSSSVSMSLTTIFVVEG